MSEPKRVATMSIVMERVNVCLKGTAENPLWF